MITNTLFEVPDRRKYTWTPPGDRARYQTDYILVKSCYKNQVKYTEMDSDHDISPKDTGGKETKREQKRRYNFYRHRKSF